MTAAPNSDCLRVKPLRLTGKDLRDWRNDELVELALGLRERLDTAEAELTRLRAERERDAEEIGRLKFGVSSWAEVEITPAHARALAKKDHPNG